MLILRSPFFFLILPCLVFFSFFSSPFFLLFLCSFLFFLFLYSILSSVLLSITFRTDSSADTNSCPLEQLQYCYAIYTMLMSVNHFPFRSKHLLEELEKKKYQLTPGCRITVLKQRWEKEYSVNRHSHFNPSTPKSDHHLISPCIITPESHINVMRIKEMITN